MVLTPKQQRIVEENMGLVGKVIKDKVHGIGQQGVFTYEELFQIGCIGLNGFGRAVLKQLRRKQKQFIRDLRADMAAEEISTIFESDPIETVDEQE